MCKAVLPHPASGTSSMSYYFGECYFQIQTTMLQLYSTFHPEKEFQQSRYKKSLSCGQLQLFNHKELAGLVRGVLGISGPPLLLSCRYTTVYLQWSSF